MITNPSSKAVLILLSAGIVLFSSCSKSNSAATGSARILFANGCVGATTATLTVNGNNLSNGSSVGYLSNSGYQTVATGAATISSVLTGVGTLGTVNTTLNSGISYSVFDCGTVLGDSLVIVADVFPTSIGSYAYARLVNVSSDTTATAITAAVGNTVIGSNIAYGAASGFVQVSPGAYNLTAFNVNKPGNVATLSSVQMNAGQVYTLMYSGNSNQVVGFKLTVINNN
jgi:Domain of unknown function (DUF4397)